MRKPLAGWLVVLAMLSACGGDGGPAPPSPRATGAEATQDPAEIDGENAVAIYAAVVRRLVEEDNTLGGGAVPFERIFVTDGEVVDASDPRAGWNEIGEPFPDAVQEGITRELRDLLPVTFVREPRSVVGGPKVCPQVRGQGVLISLGAIEGDGDRVEVPNELYLACLGAQWLTYVVEREADEWQVTGVTGPVELV